MPSVINRGPTGLLGVLDIKSQGENPRSLLDEVRPGIDLTELYRLGRERTAYGSCGSGWNTVGSKPVSSILVPVNAFWFVTGWGITTGVIGAGVAIRVVGNLFTNIAPNVLSPGTNSFAEIPLHEPISGVAGEALHQGGIGGFWMGPGDTMSLRVIAVTGGNGPATDFRLRLYEYPT